MQEICSFSSVTVVVVHVAKRCRGGCGFHRSACIVMLVVAVSSREKGKFIDLHCACWVLGRAGRSETLVEGQASK